MNERASSSLSLSKGSPTAGHLSKSHRQGSSTRLHKTHAVGHGRHPHGRVPSYGKGLHKLSKLGTGNVGEEPLGQGRNHNRSSSDTPSSSPNASNVKRNSSNLSLPKTGSKVSLKKNTSHVTLPRNGSTAKSGNQAKSDKAQTRQNLQKKGTNDAPLKGIATFHVGDDNAQDEDWTEDSSSMSPSTTRNSSRPKTPVSRDPPSPDDPPDKSPQNLPASPPESPPDTLSNFKLCPPKLRPESNNDQQKAYQYSQPPDAEAVTHRLLSRNQRHTPAPQASDISASITPPVHVGSPSPAQTYLNHHEPSMPANGISRFLSTTGPGSGSTTPNSVSHLQSTLAHMNSQYYRSKSPIDSASKVDTRRSKSAANLTTAHVANEDDTPLARSPPSSPRSTSAKASKQKAKHFPSPFQSARGADPNAGKSLTQLKLDLQRIESQRDSPTANHLLLNQGSMLNMADSMSSADMAGRLKRHYLQAHGDVSNSHRFYPKLIPKKLPEKAIERHAATVRDRKLKKINSNERGSREVNGPTTIPTPVGSTGEMDHGRGHVQFQVGPRSFEDGTGSGGEDGGVDDADGIEGLLHRMWNAPESREIGDGDE